MEKTWFKFQITSQSLHIRYQVEDYKAMYIIPVKFIRYMKFENVQVVYAVNYDEETDTISETTEPSRRKESWLVTEGSDEDIWLPMLVGQALYKFLIKKGIF